MCAASDESISTLNCPDCCLSFYYLLSGAKKPFKLAFTPPPFFFLGSIFSLSLCLFSLPLLFYSSVPRLPHRKHIQIIKTNIYRAGPVFIHQNNMVIFLLLFFFVNESE